MYTVDCQTGTASRATRQFPSKKSLQAHHHHCNEREDDSTKKAHNKNTSAYFLQRIFFFSALCLEVELSLITMTSSSATIRAYVSHKPQWQSFQTPLMAPSHQVAAVANKKKEVVHPYQRQYAHVYHQRYHQLAPLCWKAVDEQQTQDDEVRVTRLLELTEGQKSVLVGTLVKESLPDETGSPPLVEGSECRASDELFLEDDSGRVALGWKHKHACPTGAVVAVRGTVGTDGVLQVEDIIYPHTTKSTSPPPPLPPTEQSSYVLLLSGLETGNPSVPPTARDMLLSFVQGRLQHPAASQVARILICGGWTASPTKEALQEADAWLDQILAAGIPVDVLPGQDDPTTANWPQRPLHRALMPRSSRNSALLHRTPNPYRAVYQDKTVVMATDGLNVRAQQRVTCVPQNNKDNDEIQETWQTPSALQVMQQHLDGRHLCPVGPSEVPTAPHADLDPMVVVGVNDDNDETANWPRLYATGGHAAFATAMSPQGTRLVAVPSFGQTGTAVLVELSSLQVHLLRFVDETN
jgi:DNA polymerase delta subunit 2